MSASKNVLKLQYCQLSIKPKIQSFSTNQIFIKFYALETITYIALSAKINREISFLLRIKDLLSFSIMTAFENCGIFCKKTFWQFYDNCKVPLTFDRYCVGRWEWWNLMTKMRNVRFEGSKHLKKNKKFISNFSKLFSAISMGSPV